MLFFYQKYFFIYYVQVQQEIKEINIWSKKRIYRHVTERSHSDDEYRVRNSSLSA